VDCNYLKVVLSFARRMKSWTVFVLQAVKQSFIAHLHRCFQMSFFLRGSLPTYCVVSCLRSVELYRIILLNCSIQVVLSLLLLQFTITVVDKFKRNGLIKQWQDTCGLQYNIVHLIAPLCVYDFTISRQ